MDDTTTTLVGGELPREIAAVFPFFETEKVGEMHEVHARIPPGLGDAFTRAFMRIDAELLLEDAAAVGRGGGPTRTHEQRGADAFVELMRRMQQTLST